jgi:hypothetical protein
VALLCFIAVVATSLAILWPRGWEFAAYPSGVVGGQIDAAKAVQIEDLYRDLSHRMHGSYLENHLALQRLAAFFQMVSALLTIEVVLWVVAIASGL